MIGSLSNNKGLRIDPVLFEKGYHEGYGPSRCTAQCCAGGVYLSQQEHRAILEHVDRIVKEFDETQTRDVSKWFESTRTDEDFPGGICIGTRVYNNKCVFLDKQSLCVLQRLKPKGYDEMWGLKPFYCRIYPITVDHCTITCDQTIAKETVCCSISSRYTKPVVEVCREELIQILGEDDYRELLRHHGNRGRRVRS